jgi:hypothetical protein
MDADDGAILYVHAGVPPPVPAWLIVWLLPAITTVPDLAALSRLAATVSTKVPVPKPVGYSAELVHVGNSSTPQKQPVLAVMVRVTFPPAAGTEEFDGETA